MLSFLSSVCMRMGSSFVTRRVPCRMTCRILWNLSGWNQLYAFNLGDLISCSQIAKQQVDDCDRVPWQDLRFLFGDVIYGGHITDPFDRNLLSTYLELFACDELMSGFDILPGMQTPTSWDDTMENLMAHVSCPSRLLDLARGWTFASGRR